MTKNQEDLMFEIFNKVESEGIRKEFDKQLKRMRDQHKHKYMDTAERWEYAYNKIKR